MSPAPLQAPGPERLLHFSRELQGATTFQDAVEATREEAAAVLGTSNAWIYVLESEAWEQVRLVAIGGSKEALAWENTTVLPVHGDAMIEEVVASRAPMVIVDARTDPRPDPKQVEAFQIRTLINIPVHLLDKPFGVLGLGTFGSEPCISPTKEQMDHVLNMATHLAVAMARIRLFEERRVATQQRQEMERRFRQVQTLETLGLLAGGVAHDFNNLLLVTLASAHMLAETPLSPDQRADLDAIVSASERGRDLIRQLMAMGRKQPLHLGAVNLNLLVRQTVQLLRRVLPAHIQLDFVEGVDLPLVSADAAQITQVLMNLCLNARDAMPEGGKLRLETEPVLIDADYTQAHPWAQPGRYVVCSVADTGVGMTPEVQARVFEPFFSTKGESGTGLGLAVTYGIVRQHEGMLQCYSELNVGTTFKLYLPTHLRAAADVGSKLDGPMPRGTERILVADDEAPVRAAVTRLLEQAGYSVVAVESGVAACAAARLQEFDLVILDAIMPGMNCRQAHDQLVQLLPGARFLFSSGHTADTLPRDFSEGIDVPVLGKPYNPPELWRAVRSVLDRGTP